jgi:ribosomal protein S18 acetylase RimI-like enzyme
VDAGLELRELDAAEFLANLDACTSVYAAAMDPPEYQLPGRHTIMERHAGYAAFRAVAALWPAGHHATGHSAAGHLAAGHPAGHPGAAQPAPAPAQAQPGAARPDPAQPGLARPDAAWPDAAWPDAARPATVQPAVTRPGGAWVAGAQGGVFRPAGTVASPNGQLALAGFAYGFHGEHGQWWHDLVAYAVAGALGRRAADDWLGDSLEIAEVHVLPGYQGQGTGLAMMQRLTAGRPERTAVLSTMDADTRARRLYRGLGFTDLIENFTFAGTEAPYAIMGAPLPLPGAPAGTERPSRW